MTEYIQQFLPAFALCVIVITLQAVFYGKRIYEDRRLSLKLGRDIQCLENTIGEKTKEIAKLKAESARTAADQDRKRNESVKLFQDMMVESAQAALSLVEANWYKDQFQAICEFIWGKPFLANREARDIIAAINELVAKGDKANATAAGLSRILLQQQEAIRTLKEAGDAKQKAESALQFMASKELTIIVNNGSLRLRDSDGMILAESSDLDPADLVLSAVDRHYRP